MAVVAVEAAAAAESRRRVLGLGLLWRPRTGRLVRREAAAGRLGFVEVIAESVGDELPSALVEAGVPVIPHGVGLGIGGARNPGFRRRVAALGRAAELCGAPLVSEHIAFVRSGRVEAGHLLPLARTRESLRVLVANVREATAMLPVPLALEPIATLVDPEPELPEAAFLAELLERTDVDLVLDLANLHVNAANRRRRGEDDDDPLALFDQLPLERIAYVHAAGGRVIDGRHHDTHADPLWPEVTRLVEELWSRHEVPGLLLERDAGFDGSLDGELVALAAARDQGRARRRRGSTASTALVVPREDPPRSLVRAVAKGQRDFLRAVGASDQGDLGALAAVLVEKRRRAIEHAAPAVAAEPGFAERFDRWARTHPLRPGGARRDAARFRRSLRRKVPSRWEQTLSRRRTVAR